MDDRASLSLSIAISRVGTSTDWHNEKVFYAWDIKAKLFTFYKTINLNDFFNRTESNRAVGVLKCKL